jgi:hypothetical protein
MVDMLDDWGCRPKQQGRQIADIHRRDQGQSRTGAQNRRLECLDRIEIDDDVALRGMLDLGEERTILEHDMLVWSSGRKED